jgi:cell division protein FtsB
MREFRARQDRNEWFIKIIHSKWFLVVLAIALFFVVRGTIRVYRNYSVASEDLDKVKEDIQTLQKRNAELDVSLEHLQTEEGKDYEIRKKLDVVKPGERVIQVIDESENTQ